jgi:NAD-dependent deacetylase
MIGEQLIQSFVNHNGTTNAMKVVVFSGAGISKESGLDTFRKGGLWDGMSVAQVANIQSWWEGPQSRRRMLEFYNLRRRQCHEAEPNGAHLALAELEAAGHTVTVVTQNVDNLHERAGSKRVLHLHGEIMKARPEDDEDTILDWPGDLNLGDLHRGSQVRPHIVWFGEGLPAFDCAYEAATESDVDVLIVVGTTLEVSPANLCAFHTKAKSVYVVDPDPPQFGTTNTYFGELIPHQDCKVLPTTAVVGVRSVVDELLLR